MLKNRLAQLREARVAGDEGFTLIELLVVVVIIGILIAIAIPLYLNYENGAKSKGAESDTRGAVSVVEQCYASNGSYPTGPISGGPGGTVDVCTTGSTTQKVNLSSNDSLTYSLSGTTNYVITVTNSDSGDIWKYDSTVGKVVKS